MHRLFFNIAHIAVPPRVTKVSLLNAQKSAQDPRHESTFVE